ncbi:MAG TPA: undecaprenyl-diphosphate phosphatase [Polyangia bacterium]|nr:undecaprenyl-diphosphate phosphatase [Polyangia bacterium]
MILLGAVQGATEFLPVSSSGHLAVGQLLGGRAADDSPLLFEVLVHVATLLAVIVVYRRDVLDLIRGGGRGLGALFRGSIRAAVQDDAGVNLALCVAAGTLPTGILGLALRHPAEMIAASPQGLGLAFLALAALLLGSRGWTGGTRRLDWKVALIIGTVQGVAVLPAISRSGVTIVTALALGLDRAEAARFSFLLAIPAILGAALLEIEPGAIAVGGQVLPLALSSLTAFAVGLVALLLLLRLVKSGRLWLFTPYVAAMGIFSLVWL